MTPSEISDLEKSEIVIARILNLVMEWGLQECSLQFEELELDEEYATFFFPCIDWLMAEGILRAKEVILYSSATTVAGGEVIWPQLTSYGFRVLGAEINLGENTQTLASAVEVVSKTKRSYAPLGDFLGGLLGGFTKSMNS